MNILELTHTQARRIKQSCAVYNFRLTAEEVSARHEVCEGYSPAVAFHTPEHWLIPLSPAYVQLEPVE